MYSISIIIKKKNLVRVLSVIYSLNCVSYALCVTKIVRVLSVSYALCVTKNVRVLSVSYALCVTN